MRMQCGRAVELVLCAFILSAGSTAFAQADVIAPSAASAPAPTGAGAQSVTLPAAASAPAPPAPAVTTQTTESREVAPPATPLTPPPRTFVFVLVGVIGAIALLALISVNGALRADNRWSLSDALSEESDLPVMDTSNAPILGSDGKVLTAPKLVASSSRLIALLGLMGILSLYLGFGTSMLYYFATGQGVPPGSTDVRNFLVAGMIMFAPYVVNKFSSIFTSIMPGQK